MNARRPDACAACVAVMSGLVSCEMHSTHVEMRSICA